MTRTTTYNRMARGELAATFVFALVLSSSVLLFERVFRIMKASQGAPALDVLKLILYIQPSLLLLGIPMSLLVAVLVVYGRMTMDHEITILSASGASHGLIIGPAMRFAAVCAAAALAVSLYFFPLSNRLFRETLYNSLATTVNIDEGIFHDGFPGLMIYVKKKLADSNYRDVFIYNAKAADEPVIVTADSGKLFSFPDKGVFRFMLENGEIHLAGTGAGYTLIKFGRYNMEFDMSGSDYRPGGNEMFPYELWREASGGPPENRTGRMVELHKRFALPAACLILGFLGVPLATLVGRTGRSGRLGGFGIALAVVAGYYILLVTGESMAQAGKLPPAVAIWGADGALAALATAAYSRWKRL